MATDHSEETKDQIPSNWNEQSDQPEDDVMEVHEGGMFGEEDDYLDPDEMPSGVDEMDAMMDQYLDQMTGSLTQGQLLVVPVVAIKTDHVLVDIGEKSEGIINIREFTFIEDRPQVELGQVIEVVVKGYDHESGLVNLSYQEARRRRALDMVNAALANQTPVKGIVTRTVKGGLIIDIGTTAFLPASQIDLRRVENFEEWIGREVEAQVIEHVPEKRRIIVSRRKLLEQEREAQRRVVMDRLQAGTLLEVTIKRLVEFGVFVDLGGVDGLIPRSEISWQRNARPDEFMNVGDTIQAKIIEIDEETGKITLSRRLALHNPWETAVEQYPPNREITGNVVSLTSYGAFVRLEEGLDGMIHISDMAWDSAGRKPQDYVQVGQEVKAVVLNVDPEAKRISLGLKQMTRDPWEDVILRYPKGTVVNGPVTGLTRYGAFIELEPGVEGMIHVSDFSWTQRINQPKDVAKKGDQIEAIVLDIDRERRRISLGVKQLQDSPISQFKAQHRVGDVVDGEVVNVTDIGAFVRLGEGIEGFLHVSQMDRERVEKPSDVVKVGEQITVKITRIESDSGKISLSRRQMMKEQEKKTISAYMKSGKSGSINSMSELFEDINLMDDLPADGGKVVSSDRLGQRPKVEPAPKPAPSEEKAPAPESVAEVEPKPTPDPAAEPAQGVTADQSQPEAPAAETEIPLSDEGPRES